MKFLRLFAIPFVLPLVLDSCSNAVGLTPEDRAKVSPMKVERHVKMPEAIRYRDGNTDATNLNAALLYGTTGIYTDPTRVSQGDRERVDEILQVKSQGAGRMMRDELIKSFRRKQVAAITDGGSASSTLQIEIKAVGMETVERFGDKMQIYLEVHATLTDRAGKTIWKTYYASYPHNELMPARMKNEYFGNPSLLREDFELTCRHVADLLADDLKSQMTDD